MATSDSTVKVRRASPSPDIRVRAFRLHQTPEPDGLNTSSTPGLTPSSPSTFVADQSRLIRQASHSSNISGHSSGRRWDASDKVIDESSDTIDIMDPHGPSSPDTRNHGDTSEPWSSAVGRATASGKSGRVIERLQTDNDKLKREMKLYAARADEEQRRGESIRSELESLRTSNQNLEAICESNKSAIARRDRKLEEVRQELQLESQRRASAQKTQAEIVQQTSQALADARRDLYREREIAANASTQYEALRSAMDKIKLDYQRRIDLVFHDMQRLSRQLDSDERRFMKLETVGEQLEFDQKRLDKTNRELNDTYKQYKHASENTISGFKIQLESAEESVNKAYEDMIATTGKMKQVMNIHRDYRGEFKN